MGLKQLDVKSRNDNSCNSFMQSSSSKYLTKHLSQVLAIIFWSNQREHSHNSPTVYVHEYLPQKIFGKKNKTINSCKIKKNK